MMYLVKRMKRVIVLLLALSAIIPFFSACDSPLGFGDSIDLEPPVLTLDNVPNPWYVNSSAVLSGTVTDNVGVDKVVCRDAINPNIIYGTVYISGGKGYGNADRWSLTVHFTEQQNNSKVTAEIIAWDKAGNTGDVSKQFVNFIVDIHPPIFEDPVIQRSPSRSAPLQNLAGLVGLEHTIGNVDLFQNGAFWISAKINEEETYARTVTLKLFDSDHDVEGQELYTAEYDTGNPFAPQWTIKEGVIASLGDAKGYNYSTRLNSGQSVYLRVSLVAVDLGGNTGTFKREDFGYLCINRQADIPKAILAGGIGEFIPPGTDIPVDIFDDDTIDEVYLDLIKKVSFLSYPGTGEERLKYILAGIKNGTIANWDGQPFEQRRTTVAKPETMTEIVKTGTTTAACGEYVLVAFVKDAKNIPHDISDPNTMAEPKWGYYEYSFSVVDDNSAIIVIDTIETSKVNYSLCYAAGAVHYHTCDHLGHDLLGTAYSTGNSPEESTFPGLADGRYFTINGYTLNEKPELGNGDVMTFKIAWIPYGYIQSGIGVERAVEQVKEAMRSGTGYPAGVQYWDLEKSTSTASSSYFVKGTPQIISEAEFTKQVFKKRFDILGGQDDLNLSYNNFRYGGALENEDKYFVLYAKNGNANETFRTIRLLGNKNKPVLKVYDLTKLPALEGYNPAITAAGAAVNQTTYYDIVREAALDLGGDLENYIASPFTPYPPHTVYKLYVKAAEENGVSIKELNMVDASDSAHPVNTGKSNLGNKDITFVMAMHDLNLKVYNFTAINDLDISGQMQRTIAITNTSQLSGIVTSTPAETYQGFGKVITLRAQFSAPVRVSRSGVNAPLLNIRYETNGKDSGVWKYTSVGLNATSGNTSSVYLDFDFRVPDDANGRLQTVDQGYGNGTLFTGDRPIYLNGARILDTEREDDVFIPGKNEPGYNLTWSENVGNLQGDLSPLTGKIILLDGIVPVVSAVIPGGKSRYALYDGMGNHNTTPQIGVTAQWYYFNINDTLEFEIRANKPIRNVGVPKIQFNIQAANGAKTGPYTAEYLRPTAAGLLFAFNVSAITGAANGFITDLMMSPSNDDWNNIVDQSGGNKLSAGSLNFSAATYKVVIDNAAPPVTSPRLNNAVPAVPAAYYGANPVLTITGTATAAQEPWGSFSQYSLDGGLTWKNYPRFQAGDYSYDNGLTWTNTPVSDGWTAYNVSNNVLTITINSGRWNLVTRQIDVAGNESAQSPVYYIEVEGSFPKLLSISTKQPRGVYKAGDTLDFILDFERPVYTPSGEPSAYIIVSDWIANTTDDTQITAVKVPVTQQPQGEAKTTLTFTWNLRADTKNMPYGITVSQISLLRVRDLYNNYGGDIGDSGTIDTPNKYAGTNLIQPGNDVRNLNGEQIKVYTFKPTLVEPDSIPRSGHISGNADANGLAIIPDVIMTNRTVIKLKFSHEIRKEIGKLYIKPYGTYPVPPVFPSVGYTDADGTYNEGFLEVLNSSNIDAYAASHNNNPNAATLRSYLYATGFVNAAGTILPNATNSVTDNKGKLLTTGQDFGPYKLTTQGLTTGNGYRADGSGTPVATGPSYDGVSAGWNTASTGAGGSTFMIPDTTSKYVLNYAHANNANTAQVNNIRTALNAAKYRWREIDVNSASVKIYRDNFGVAPASMGMYVEIQLDTALAKGFRWEVQWEEGVFVDEAGNSAASYGYDLSAGTRVHWFWTEGVQPPVIRVERSSLDWRTIADRRGLDGKPPSAAAPGTASGGTHYRSFDTVNFRIESETPGADISYATLLGQDQLGNRGTHQYGAIQAAWTGNIGGTASMAWTATAVGDDTTGTWILPNLLRRAIRGRTGNVVNDVRQTTPGLAYNVTRNGSTSLINGQGSYRGFRSYNRDATFAQMEALAVTAASAAAARGSITGSVQLSVSTTDAATLNSLRASKNYIAAQAKIINAGADHTAKGYEGVFKTVVVLSSPFSGNDKVFSNTNGHNPQIIYGCNNIGSSSIAGFPLLPASTDQRFLRCVYTDHGAQFLWISTEIVSSLYLAFLSSQNNGDLKACPFNAAGDTGSFVSGSYGDLTYSYNQDMPF